MLTCVFSLNLIKNPSSRNKRPPTLFILKQAVDLKSNVAGLVIWAYFGVGFFNFPRVYFGFHRLIIYSSLDIYLHQFLNLIFYHLNVSLKI